MASSSALPETLRSVTSTKIQELKKQRELYENNKKQIIRDAKPYETDLDHARQLLKGACQHANVPYIQDDASYDNEDNSFRPTTDLACNRRNQQVFLPQAAQDPAFSNDLVVQIHYEIADHLKLQSVQHEHAQFFSELVTEWLSSATDQPVKTATTTDQAKTVDSAFENIGRKEMHEQRAQWESIVFSPAAIDESRLQKYLDDLFKSDRIVRKSFDPRFIATRNYCDQLQATSELFDTDGLQSTIRGVLKLDLLSTEKCGILKSFQNNDAVLQEVADVLNMRFASLDSWNWTTINGAIPVEQRRQLNGKYRVFTDEDILDALLLHAIGMKFAVHFRDQLVAFFESSAWSVPAKHLVQKDRERRRYFLNEEHARTTRTVEQTRKQQYKDDYFMSLLPENEQQGTRDYDGDAVETDDRKSPVEIKQGLLHLLATEALVAKHLYPNVSHAAIRSDFKWFGPSLPHTSIFVVLKYFGVTEFWLVFFEKFLQAPMRFLQDGPDGGHQVRKRGVPMSHALSDVFGEVMLSVMDFAVNRSTQSYLYRLHDDFWFWGPEELCARGWQSMTTFASMVGIEFNTEKTGSVVFGQGDDESGTLPASKQSALPAGDVRWGFLRLEPRKVQFVIDQGLVDEHITELKSQLSYCTSIFGYIQAYNAYLARFFTNNFGKPSNAFGRDHIDDMISTFAKIQRALFPSSSVSTHLATQAAERFGVVDIPDGVWYWPVKMGGLELRNPLVPLYCMRETMRQSPRSILSKCDDLEEHDYLSDKVRFDNDIRLYGKRPRLPSTEPTFGNDFMSKAEYLRYRESRSSHLQDAYAQLLTIPSEFAVHQTKDMMAWLEKLPEGAGRSRSGSASAGIANPFHDMTPYWKWILAVYGAQIVEKYGSIQIVNPAQVPLGVVSVMKAGKVRWQG